LLESGLAFNVAATSAPIDAINIRTERIIVDLPEQFVQQVLAKNGDYQVRKQRSTILRAKQ
jgi:hypothetical protein